MADQAVELLIDGRAIRVSSPGKVYFERFAMTKLDVVEYFRSVGPGIVGAVKDRPTTMERWPRGVREGMVLATRSDASGDAFFQKRAPANTPPWVGTAEVEFPSGRTAREVAPADLADVVWMVNLGTVRFHPWPVRAADPSAVDQLRIDLDPQPGVGFETAIIAAQQLREVLSEAGWPDSARPVVGGGFMCTPRLSPSTSSRLVTQRSPSVANWPVGFRDWSRSPGGRRSVDLASSWTSTRWLGIG